MAEENEPDENETLFLELMDKRGLEWLKKNLTAILPDLKTPSSQGSKTGPEADSLGNFLRELLAEEKTRSKTLAEKLESVLEILTPEQRTLLRSPKSASAGDPPKGAPPPNPDPTEPPKKRGFLARL
jgi:hypothetical protein